MLRHEEPAFHGQTGLRKRAVYKEDGWSSDVMAIDLIAAINLVSLSVTNVIGGGNSRGWYYTSCNLARTHLNDSVVSSFDRNAKVTEKDVDWKTKTIRQLGGV